jgi:hypothetical protein
VPAVAAVRWHDLAALAAPARAARREECEMQDAELFIGLAGIAGVFVGFGALIAVRGSGTSDFWSVAGIGLLVISSVQAIILALAPVVIGRFEPPAHALWVSCSLLFLVVFGVAGELVDRAFPERMEMRRAWPRKARWRMELVSGVLVMLPMHVSHVLSAARSRGRAVPRCADPAPGHGHVRDGSAGRDGGPPRDGAVVRTGAPGPRSTQEVSECRSWRGSSSWPGSPASSSASGR